MKLSLPKYVTKLIKKFPDIASGRKNFQYYENRIRKNLELTKKYVKKKISVKK